ncbi:hypothetical protein B4102_4061 [Heyndrickxia sporothermodurans]|uniref:NERD domain-containing protein n=2 Tax=Heyndrickxia sporothermodurans TaxID=46224 RepID=A0A150KKF7_9BACI|nr:hypothetical protein B4102_4061 [Heyndrickxia sporothermodurans]
MFDKWLATLPNWKILNDLRFEWNNISYQIDSLSIFSNTIHHFEVKNYEGDYYIEKDTWYLLSGTEISNPLIQLERTESLLRRFIKNLGFNYSIESYLIFINPEFHLYHAPRNPKIIFPNQLPRFMKNLRKKTSKIAYNHTKIIDQLISYHVPDSPYMRIPKYTFDELKKGIICPSCHTFYTAFNKKYLVCDHCGNKEYVTSAVLRCIEEFTLLFPERKLTVKEIQEWSKIIPHQTVRRIIANNYKIIRQGKTSYYIHPDK